MAISPHHAHLHQGIDHRGSNYPKRGDVGTLTSSTGGLRQRRQARRCRSGFPMSWGVQRTSSPPSKATTSSRSCTGGLFTTIGTGRRPAGGRRCLRGLLRVMRDALPAAYGEPATGNGLSMPYPFHPELVDILTNRWGSLSGFQRTRGALRTLAHTVKALAQRNRSRR